MTTASADYRIPINLSPRFDNLPPDFSVVCADLEQKINFSKKISSLSHLVLSRFNKMISWPLDINGVKASDFRDKDNYVSILIGDFYLKNGFGKEALSIAEYVLDVLNIENDALSYRRAYLEVNLNK
jgi:hypothetical protein